MIPCEFLKALKHLSVCTVFIYMLLLHIWHIYLLYIFEHSAILSSYSFFQCFAALYKNILNTFAYKILPELVLFSYFRFEKFTV